MSRLSDYAQQMRDLAAGFVRTLREADPAPDAPAAEPLGERLADSSRRTVRGMRGFTLTEVLTVVGLVLIMTSIGFVGVIQMRDSLRFMQMNDTAREIYIVGQDQMARGVQRGSLQEKLDVTGDRENSWASPDAAMGTHIPAGTALSSHVPAEENTGQFFYLHHAAGPVTTGTVLDDILPAGSIDEGIREGDYVIVYNAATATVFEVFFTDGENGSLPDYLEVLNSADMRSDDYRRDSYKDAVIGYYGGTTVNMAGISLTDLSVSVHNGNRLTAVINYPNPLDTAEQLQSGQTAVFSLVVKGRTSGQELTIPVATKRGATGELRLDTSLSTDFLGAVLDSQTVRVNTTTTQTVQRAGIVLDDVTSSKSHFAQLFKDFVPGEDLEIYATMTVQDTPAASRQSNHVVANSLFGSVAAGTEAGELDVTVGYIRHLENLDATVSGFSAKALQSDTSALAVTQTNSFAWENLSQEESRTFASAAVENVATATQIYDADITNGIITNSGGTAIIGRRAYYGVKVDTDPSTFSYDGGGNAIINAWMSAPSGQSVGLFREVVAANATFENITLATPTVVAPGGSGVYAGSLIGEVRSSGTFKVQSCSVVRNAEKDEDDRYTYGGVRRGTISGTSAATGGLIGRVAVASGTIYDSFTALRKVDGTGIVGGFIGEVNGSSGALTIDGCYAAGRTFGGKYDEKEEHNLGFNVQTTGNAAGGLVGQLTGRQSSGIGLTLLQSYATTSVKAPDGSSAGGLMGRVDTGSLSIDSCYATGLVDATVGDDATDANANRHAFVGGVTTGTSITSNKERNFYLSHMNSGLEPDLDYAKETLTDILKRSDRTATPVDGTLPTTYDFLTCLDLGRTGSTALDAHSGDWPKPPEDDDTFFIVNTNRLSAVLFADKPKNAVIRLIDPTNTNNFVDLPITPSSGWVDTHEPGDHQYYYEWILDDPTIAGKNWASQFGDKLDAGGNYIAKYVLLPTYNESEALGDIPFSSLFADNNTVDSVDKMNSITLDDSVAYIAYARHLQNLNADVSGLKTNIETITQLRTLTWAVSLGGNVVGETEFDTVDVKPGNYQNITSLYKVWQNTQRMSGTEVYAYSTNEPLRDKDYRASNGNFLSIPSCTATTYSTSGGSFAIRNFKSGSIRPAIFELVNHNLTISNIDIEGAHVEEQTWKRDGENNFAAIFVAQAENGTLKFINIDMSGIYVKGIRTTGALVGSSSASIEIDDVHILPGDSGASKVEAQQGWAGGLVGEVNGSGTFTAKNSSVTLGALTSGNTNESQDVGGFVGQARNGATFTSCEATLDSIYSPQAHAGGLSGLVAGNKMIVTDCTVEVGSIQSGSNEGAFSGGLCGSAEKGVTVTNSTFEGAKITSNGKAGGLFGQVDGGMELTNVETAVGETITGAGDMGGLVGRVSGVSTVTNCLFEGEEVKSSGSSAGGLVGEATGGLITVTGSEAYVTTISGANWKGASGGIIGNAQGGAVVTGCDYTGSTISGRIIGGIVGNSEATVLNISDCSVSADTFTGSAQTGGYVGFATKGATVSDAVIADMTISGDVAAGIVAETRGGNLSISDSSVTNTIVQAGNGGAGGLAAFVDGRGGFTDSYVYDCVVSSNNWHAGGLAGTVGHGTKGLHAENCFASVAVRSQTQSAGGLFGYAGMAENDTIENCYASGHTDSGVYGTAMFWLEGTGVLKFDDGTSSLSGCYNVHGGDSAGGLIGKLENEGTATISDCYATTSAHSGSGQAGGFIASIAKAGVTCDDCYATGLVGGANLSSFVSGGVAIAQGSTAFYLETVNGAESSDANKKARERGASSTDGTSIAGDERPAIPYSLDLGGTYPYWTRASIGPDTEPETTGYRHFGDWVDLSKIDPNGYSDTYRVYVQGPLEVEVTCNGQEGNNLNRYAITITNTGSETVNGWEINIPFQSSIVFDSMWGGRGTANGAFLNIASIDDNGNPIYTYTIQPNGGTQSFGFAVRGDSRPALAADGFTASYNTSS